MIKKLIVKDNKKVNSKADYIRILNGYINQYLDGKMSRELYVYSVRLIDKMVYIDNTMDEENKMEVYRYIENIVKLKAV
jgi:aspartate/glutamate racemase